MWTFWRFVGGSVAARGGQVTHRRCTLVHELTAILVFVEAELRDTHNGTRPATGPLLTMTYGCPICASDGPPRLVHLPLYSTPNTLLV